jgi:acetate kinase
MEVLVRDVDTREEARFALETFVYHTARHVASQAVALGGIDMLVFSGGIGERSAYIRAGVAKKLEFLGIALDEAKNSAPDAHTSLEDPHSRVMIRVLHPDEEQEMYDVFCAFGA